MASSPAMRFSHLSLLVLPFILSQIGCGAAPAAPEAPASSDDADSGGAASPGLAVSGAAKKRKLREAEGGGAGNDDATGGDEADDEFGGGSGAGGPVPQAAQVDTPLGGQLSKAEIRKIVLARGELFDRCYTIGARGGVQFVAKVEVKAFLGPSGKVNRVEVLKSTAKNPKVDECVSDAFKQIQFPKPHDGATSVITFPVEFQGAEQVN